MQKSQAQILAEEIGVPDPFFSLQQETFLNLLRTSTQLLREFTCLFESVGLTDSQFNVLRILQGHKEPMQIYQIVEHMITPQTDISRLIERLAKAKFVLRMRCNKDRRVVWIRLSPKGRAVLKKLVQPLKELHLAQFKNLSQKELSILNSLLFRARQSSPQ